MRAGVEAWHEAENGLDTGNSSRPREGDEGMTDGIGRGFDWKGRCILAGPQSFGRASTTRASAGSLRPGPLRLGGRVEWADHAEDRGDRALPWPDCARPGAEHRACGHGGLVAECGEHQARVSADPSGSVASTHAPATAHKVTFSLYPQRRACSAGSRVVSRTNPRTESHFSADPTERAVTAVQEVQARSKRRSRHDLCDHLRLVHDGMLRGCLFGPSMAAPTSDTRRATVGAQTADCVHEAVSLAGGLSVARRWQMCKDGVDVRRQTWSNGLPHEDGGVGSRQVGWWDHGLVVCHPTRSQ